MYKNWFSLIIYNVLFAIKPEQTKQLLTLACWNRLVSFLFWEHVIEIHVIEIQVIDIHIDRLTRFPKIMKSEGHLINMNYFWKKPKISFLKYFRINVDPNLFRTCLSKKLFESGKNIFLEISKIDNESKRAPGNFFCGWELKTMRNL